MKTKYAIGIYLILMVIAFCIFAYLLSSCNLFFNHHPVKPPSNIDTMGVTISAPDEQGNEIYTLQVSHDNGNTFNNLCTVNSTLKKIYHVEITTDTGIFRFRIIQAGNTTYSQKAYTNWGY